MGNIVEKKFNAESYKKLMLEKLECLTKVAHRNKGNVCGVLVNMERVGLVFALELMNDKRCNDDY